MCGMGYEGGDEPTTKTYWNGNRACCCALPAFNPDACKNCPSNGTGYQYTVTTGTTPPEYEEKVIKVPKGKKVTIIIE